MKKTLDLNNLITLDKWAKQFLDGKILNKRAKLDIGKFCNLNCFFCYYKNDLKSKDFLSVNNAGILTRYLLDKGIEEIELSGGEPTVHPKILDIVSEIKKEFQRKNKEPKISIVTNGTCTNEKFLKLQEDIKEWLFSLHGSEYFHDKIVGKNDSFQRIFSKIKLIKDLNLDLIIRFNFVVTTYNNESNLNYGIQKILQKFLDQGYQINLLPLNYWKDAVNLNSDIKDTLNIYGSINKFVQRLDSDKILEDSKNFRNPLLNIRYPQYCLLSSKARLFARGHYDHIIDTQDWNKLFYPKDFNPNLNLLSTDGIDPLLIYPNEELNIQNIIQKTKFDRIVSHYKDTICKKCKHFENCDGIKLNSPDIINVRRWFVNKPKEIPLLLNQYLEKLNLLGEE